jgi:carboxymethylenebutenolidase
MRIRTGDGAWFDCHLAAPAARHAVPAVVLASAIHGVDADLHAIAGEFAACGYLAAAPDLFWRTVPGPLARDDPRASPRGQPRLERIRAGLQDMAEVLAMLRAHPGCNGRVAAMGFCYGGPYAILGPKRLGYDAGISCHGTQMLDYLGEIEGVHAPVCLVWGDADSAAPAPVLAAYSALPARMPNVEVHVLPGVQHGYMMPGNTLAFDAKARAFSLERALAVLEALRHAKA